MAEGGQDVLTPLAAVQTLFSTERRAAEYDILISTALECIRTGRRSLNELVDAVRRVWPGAEVSRPSVEAAIAAATAAGLVVPDQGAYRLTGDGLREVERSRRWAQEVHDRVAADLRIKATRVLYDVDNAQAGLWVALIANALFAGVSAAAAAYRGDVQLAGDSLVLPRTINRDALQKALPSSIKPEVREFLEAMAFEALDPSEPFGNDLVTGITTGYLLQAFLARRDAIRTRQALGSIRGQVVIVDTPVLFQLLGFGAGPEAIQSAISAGIEAGSELVVCEHTVDEVNTVFRRIERDEATQVIRTTVNRQALALARRLADEPLVRIFLDGLEAQAFSNWNDFRGYISNLPKELRSRGIAVEAHGNLDTDRVNEFDTQLYSQLTQRGRGRGTEEIRRDAHTMALGARVRRERPKPSGVWPSAWVLTTDTHMAIAYRRVVRDDKDSLTITPSQWVSVISAFADPATVETLAKTGGVLLAQETMLRVASRFPSAAVVEIIAVVGDKVDEVEVLEAQLSLDDLLRSAPAAGGARELGIAAAGRILERRAERQELLNAAEAARLDQIRQELEREGERLAADAERERARRVEVDEHLEEERDRRKAAEEAIQRERILSRRGQRRLIGSIAFVFVAALLGVLWITTDAYDGALALGSIGSLVSGILLYAATDAWASDPAVSGRGLWWVFVPQLLAVPGLLRDFGVL